MSAALFSKGRQKWDSDELVPKPQVILCPGFPKISSFRGEPMHPLTDGFVRSTRIPTVRRNPLVLVGFTSQTIGGQRLIGRASCVMLAF